MIQILPTDTAFPDSPDTGPDCLCSRCGKAIEDVAIRAVKKPDGTVDELTEPTDEQFSTEYTFTEIGTYTFTIKEWRYHPACQEDSENDY